MGVHIARWVVATLNVLLSLLFTVLFVVIVQLRPFESSTGTSISIIFYWSFYALLTVAAMMTAALLLRRRTVQTGLQMHFALANVGLLFALMATAVEALSHSDHHVTAWLLHTAYWIGAVSGLWFGTGLTLKTLIECEDAKRDVGINQFQGMTIKPVASETTSAGYRQILSLPITATETATPEILSHRRVG